MSSGKSPLNSGEVKSYYETMYTAHSKGPEQVSPMSSLERYFAARRREVLKRYIDQGKIALDIGCGLGPGLRLIGSNYASPIGLDIARSALEQVDSPLLVEADVLDLPFVDDIVEFIHCSAVFQHVSDPRRALGEMLRVLAPQGRALIVVPNKDAAHRRLFRGLTWIGRNLLRAEGGGADFLVRFFLRISGRSLPKAQRERLRRYVRHGHLPAFSAAEFKALVQQSGFKLVTIHGLVFVPPIGFPFNALPAFPRALELFERLLVRTPSRSLLARELLIVLERA